MATSQNKLPKYHMLLAWNMWYNGTYKNVHMACISFSDLQCRLDHCKI